MLRILPTENIVDLNSFRVRLQTSLPMGTVLPNPGSGTTTIAWCDDERLCYRRGKSLFYVGVRELHEAYVYSMGRDVTTGDLKAHAPHIFDSANRGHNCNCTVLFLALQQMGLVGGIWGRGRRGTPFGVTVRSTPERGEPQRTS